MNEISGDDFSTAIQNANLQTAIDPLVSGTSPDLTPSQLLDEVITAYRSTQQTTNDNSTAPEQINTVGASAEGSLVETPEGEVYRTISRTVTIRKNFSEGTVSSDFIII